MGNCTHFTSPEPTFLTNGVPNTDQSRLDLQEGTDISQSAVGGEVTTSGTGGSGPNFADAEVPSGLINSSNTTYILAHSPSPPSSLQLYRNGVVQTDGIDYTLAANVITMAAAPDGTPPPDTLISWYRY